MGGTFDLDDSTDNLSSAVVLRTKSDCDRVCSMIATLSMEIVEIVLEVVVVAAECDIVPL